MGVFYLGGCVELILSYPTNKHDKSLKKFIMLLPKFNCVDFKFLDHRENETICIFKITDKEGDFDIESAFFCELINSLNKKKNKKQRAK